MPTMVHVLCCSLALLLVSAAMAQDEAAAARRVARLGERSVVYFVQAPTEPASPAWRPLIVWFASAVGEEAAASAWRERGEPLAKCGFVVVSATLTANPADLEPLFAELRRTFRIEQGGLHAAAFGDTALAVQAVLAHRHEFQTFTAVGDAGKADLAALRRLPARRVHSLATSDADEIGRHFVQLHAQRSSPGAGGDVARALDDFHDAAANGDEERYFTIFPSDAVFLGTDGTERWTGSEFRAFAMPYFQRDSAWTYVPLQRHVTVEPGDALAWFDEVLDNAAYGECRGSGVLVKRAERWVLRQYNLTVPLPNDLSRSVAARIRAFVDGVAPAVSTVVVVRHAEKVDASADAALSAEGEVRAEALAVVLRDLPIAAVYTSPFQRTAATVAPLCKQRAVTSVAVPADDGKSLAAMLRKQHAGQCALVCGHSNTVPALLKALGVTEPVTIADGEFDRLFVVTIGPDGTRLLSLRYAGK